MFGAGLSLDSRFVALALAVIFADPVTGEAVVLHCTSGFVKCLYGWLVCEPGRIVCRDGELVCAHRLSKDVCDLGLLNRTKPPDLTFPPEYSTTGEDATSTAGPTDVIGTSTLTIGLAPGSRKYKLVPLWSWPSPVRWPTTEWLPPEKTFPPEHPTGGEDATSTAGPIDAIGASTSTIGLAPGSRKYKLVPLWSWPTPARWPTTEWLPPEKTFPPEHPTVSEEVSQEQTPSSDSSSTLTESEVPPGLDVSGDDTAKPSQPETSPITDMTSRSTTHSGLAPGSRKYKLVPLWSWEPAESRASTAHTHSSSPAGDRTTSPGQVSSTESSSTTEWEEVSPVPSTHDAHPSSPEPPETVTSPEGIQPDRTSPYGGPEVAASGHSTHGTVGTGHPSPQPFPTRRPPDSTRPRPPCSLTPKDTDIIRDMQARFLRLFVTSISSRGIKLVDTIFSYKDSQRRGVEVTATSVSGLFNGNKPEVSVLWRRYTRNYNELFLEVRIMIKKLGEVHAKIQFRSNDGTLSGLNPVLVLLGEATYLATITVLRDSGVGYGFSLKSEKVHIDDYVMSKDADHASLKKIGPRSVNQLVRRMIRTHLVEISLVNLLSNPWRNLCIPSVSAQCSAE